jgi:hypothetical protein
MSLFAGARLRGWKAYAILGGYSAATPLVCLSFLISVFIGTRLQKTANPLAIGAGAVAGSVQFILITNFAWFAGSSMYPFTAVPQ